MKRKLITLSVLLLSGSALFAQKVNEMPAFQTEAEKAAWIKEHPQDYERLSGEKVTLMPNFSSSEEKEAWIKANPQEYIRMGGDPAAIPVPEFSTQEEKDAYVRKMATITFEEDANETKPLADQPQNPQLEQEKRSAEQSAGRNSVGKQ